MTFLVAVLSTGTVWRHASRRYPCLGQMNRIVDRPGPYVQIDLNAATREELVALPYIGEYTARRIIEYRQAHGPFRAVEELKHVTGIREKNYAKFAPFLKVPQDHE